MVGRHRHVDIQTEGWEGEITSPKFTLAYLPRYVNVFGRTLRTSNNGVRKGWFLHGTRVNEGPLAHRGDRPMIYYRKSWW
jgi:hypothetical protein